MELQVSSGCGYRTVGGRQLRRDSGEVFHELAPQKKHEEGRLLPDRGYVLISIPVKYSGGAGGWFLKDKSAIYIAWVFGGRWGDLARQ